MKISSVSFGFGRKPQKLYPGYNVRSLMTNRIIVMEDISKDIQEYAKQAGLMSRKLTDKEKHVFMHLPNTEVKRMYLQKILAPIKKIL